MTRATGFRLLLQILLFLVVMVLVDELNSSGFEIHAPVDTIDVIGYDGTRTWPVDRFELA